MSPARASFAAARTASPVPARHRPRADDPAVRVHLGEEADFLAASAADFAPDRTDRVRREGEWGMVVAQVFWRAGAGGREEHVVQDEPVAGREFV